MPTHILVGGFAVRIHGPARSLDLDRVRIAEKNAIRPRFMEKYRHPRHKRGQTAANAPPSHEND